MTKPTDEELLQWLDEALRECSDNLQHELDAHYCAFQDVYPDLMKKYSLDILPVTKARNALAAYEASKATCKESLQVEAVVKENLTTQEDEKFDIISITPTPKKRKIEVPEFWLDIFDFDGFRALNAYLSKEEADRFILRSYRTALVKIPPQTIEVDEQ